MGKLHCHSPKPHIFVLLIFYVLQVLADFIGAINEDWFCQCNVVEDSYNFAKEITASFTSIPHTTSAVALWLVKLDTLMAPYLERPRSGKLPGIRC